MEIKLPELKEDVDTVEVNEVLIKEGDEVQEGQPLLEVQADKSALEIPSPSAGRVKAIQVKAGQEIKVGDVICTLEAGSAKEEEQEPEPEPESESESEPEEAQESEKESESAEEEKPEQEESSEPVRLSNEEVVPAGPATRRLARELGVDLRQVNGSGRQGRITQQDIREHVKHLASGGATSVSVSLPDFEQFGPIERQKLSRMRQATSRQMSRSWSQIPHVTQHDEADITELEAFRQSQKGKEGPRITVTAFVLKALSVALKKFPSFNASLDPASEELVLKRYYHLGVAVDTDKGLLVPVIRDVDQKSVTQLASELTETAENARNGRAEMQGGTFTLTNLGGIGGTAFTPIVNHPEVAILGLSRGKWQPQIQDGELTERLILPLSLSYDHRVIDGADAARFTRLVAELLENPWTMLLHV